MRASEIALTEQQFLQIGLSKGKISPRQVNHPDGLPFHLNIYSPGHDAHYFQEEFPKERIVLHFTAGFLQGDVPWLTRVPPVGSPRVSVPFVIARSGEIFNLYRSAYWAYHLGVGDKRWDRTSLGIEVSNIGPLVLLGDTLHYQVGKKLPDGRTVPQPIPYCTLNEQEFFVRRSYRGFDFFASYTDPQYDALARLIVYLTNRYHIPRSFLPISTRFEATDQNRAHRGIVSHVNYRPQGKWDIGPAFDWPRLEAAVVQHQSIFQP